MARIDSLGESSYPVPDRKKAGRRDKAQRKSFSDLVGSASESREASAEDLDDDDPRRGIEEMLDAVFASGDQLKRGPTLEAIREYRHRVRDFVRYAVGRAIAVEETTSGTNILKRKRFTMVKVIDEKLEALAQSVLSSQKDQLAILAQVDEINGLLVDLVS